MKNHKSKNNDKYFMEIPKPNEKINRDKFKNYYTNLIINALNEIEKIKREKLIKIQEKRKIHKEVYNLALKKQAHEKYISKLLKKLNGR